MKALAKTTWITQVAQATEYYDIPRRQEWKGCMAKDMQLMLRYTPCLTMQ